MDKVKVAAIFDKPMCCGECPCSYYTEDPESPTEDHCKLAGPENEITYRGPIPDWCPLVEPHIIQGWR